MIKRIIQKFLSLFGFQLVRKGQVQEPIPSPITNQMEITDIEKLAEKCATIPGMIDLKSGQFLYTLCYMQSIAGDVAEIGSWQGRSTAFLAQAVKDSKNGNFYAIDHFKGNIGKEHFYKIGNDDLSDLKVNFNKNIKNAGVSDYVNLLDMPNYEAIKTLQNKKLRFLFIDGDHTAEGVKRDLDLFLPLLNKGSIIVFDDYSNHFPGLVNVVNQLILDSTFEKSMYYHNTLVLQI